MKIHFLGTCWLIGGDWSHFGRIVTFGENCHFLGSFFSAGGPFYTLSNPAKILAWVIAHPLQIVTCICVFRVSCMSLVSWLSQVSSRAHKRLQRNKQNSFTWFTMANLLQHYFCTRLLHSWTITCDAWYVAGAAAWLVHQSLISPLQEKNLSKSLLVNPWLFSMWWSPMSRSTCYTILLCHFDIVMCETSKTCNGDVWNLQDKQ